MVVVMKKSLTIRILFIAILFLLSSPAALAQFNDYTAKLGIQGNIILPDTEFDKDLKPSDASYKFSGLGRAFVRFEFFTEVVETEIGAGFGRLAGVDSANNNWWTYIIPLDVRFILSPFEMDVWNPYIYAGAGAMFFNNDKQPLVTSPNSVEQKAWTGIFPVGGGFEIALSDAIALDINGGYTFTLSDDLNGYNNERSNDGYYYAGLGLIFVSGSGASDKDGDGLTKREEKELGTDPNNPDTDGDRLQDGEEVRTHVTDPLNTDTDADNLGDGEEVLNRKTDPNKADTDGDGLNDGDEVNTHKTDPLKLDTDGDNLNDGIEVTELKTNPLLDDSDGDNLKDGAEVNVHKTDPNNIDTDAEGLKDGEEVNMYRTDPLNPDTDAGTVDDFTEVNRGTNPLNPDDDVVKMDVPIVLEGITFETGKWDITPESELVLQGALQTMMTYEDIIVEISGHTDNVGSNASNQKLSQRRADSVRFWLIQKGVAPDRIIAKGYGEEFPRVPNDTPDNKRMNRRIEFKRIK
jgi:outer membrane protein OmpA-like peptidoglycan-associated protein